MGDCKALVLARTIGKMKRRQMQCWLSASAVSFALVSGVASTTVQSLQSAIRYDHGCNANLQGWPFNFCFALGPGVAFTPVQIIRPAAYSSVIESLQSADSVPRRSGMKKMGTVRG